MITPVYLERGTKKVFACAPQWPGWCRSGRTDEAALEALAAYVPRYAVVAEQAGIMFPADAGGGFRITERLPGSMTTDFGAPGGIAASDSAPMDAEEAQRTAALVAAAWTLLDSVVDTAPAALRKGPRGGGRDRDAMVDHVLGAEAAYARKLGLRHRQPALADAVAIAALREAILAVVGAPSDGAPPVAKGWPVRYAARRIAWHVLDHAWEMQDRAHGGSPRAVLMK